MNLRHLVPLIILALGLGASASRAQFKTSQPDNASPSQIDQESALANKVRAALSSHTYSWERIGYPAYVLNFSAAGKAATSEWVATYDVVDAQTIVLHLDTRTAELHFSKDYESYTGIDFDTVTKLTGKALHQGGDGVHFY